MFLELAISGSIESVEAGRSSGDVLFDFVGFGEDAELVDLFAEVAFVERLFEDEFVEVLELGKGEFFGKKFEAGGLIAEGDDEVFCFSGIDAMEGFDPDIASSKNKASTSNSNQTF